MNACERLSEVEAARDGRTPLDTEHVASCQACQAEWAALEKLSRALAPLRVAPVDREALARAREAVLGNAFAPRRAIRWQRLALAAAVACGIGSGALLAFKWSVPAAQTRIQAVDEGAARWRVDSRDDLERITLTEGTLRLSVTRPANGKQVVVQVPDGTIEDIGTVFHVVVAHGQTQEVRVDQGAVRLTLAGLGVIDVHAGERWARNEAVPAVGARGSAPEANTDDTPSTPPGPPAVEPEPARTPPSPSTSQAPTPPRREPRAPSTRDDRDESDDEDAAYLEVIRRAREGSASETSEAAHKYLEKYPQGFRAREVQSLVR